MALLVSNVPWTKDGNSREVLCAHLQIDKGELIEFELLKRSIDARRRPPVWQANYRVVLTDERRIIAQKKHGVRAYSKRDAKRYQQIQLDLDTPIFPKGHKTIVIGAGPAGSVFRGRDRHVLCGQPEGLDVARPCHGGGPCS